MAWHTDVAEARVSARASLQETLALLKTDGACVGMATDLFFPGRFDDEKVLAAKQVCAGCAVSAECLRYALLTGETQGIWGGTSGKERRTHWRREALVRRTIAG